MKTQEEKTDFINQLETDFLSYVVRQNRINPEREMAIIKEISAIAKGEKNYPTTLNKEITNNNFRTATNYLNSLISRNYTKFKWNETDELIKGYLNKESILNLRYLGPWEYIKIKFTLPSGSPGFESFQKYISDIGVSDEQLTSIIGARANIAFQTIQEDNKVKETCFATYIKPRLEGASSFLGLKKKKGLGSILDDLVGENANFNHAHFILKFLLTNSPDSISNLEKYILSNNTRYGINIHGVKELLDNDPVKYEKLIVNRLPQINKKAGKFSVLLLLAEKFPEKYHEQIKEIGEQTLQKYCRMKINKNEYLRYDYSYGGSMEIVYSRYLYDRNKKDATERLKKYTIDSKYITGSYLDFIDTMLHEAGLPLLLNCLHKEYSIVDNRWKGYYKKLFALLDKYDLSNHTDDIIRFGINNTPKKYRILASNALKKYIDKVTPRALQLLGGNVQDRIFGAMILQHSSDQSIIDQLTTLIDTERSDDTRDILLDALNDIKFGTGLSKADVDDMITKAHERKKLNKWSEKWILEEDVPKLYWKENGHALSEQEIRFLFYRMKRIKGISSDIEAKQVIEHLNEQKSEKFAMALIKAYQDSNANSKFKYYLVMAGLIGKDTILTRLHTVFNTTVSSKRYRMAAMIVGAIAMVGSNKALRIVDLISRKFASKRPQIRRGAVEALDAAALELDITKDQLADRIIPNLGFEDHYYAFEAGGDSYRAFINQDFKLNYFNEDNKLRKSMPKDVSRETKAALKAKEKEIKEVHKAQKGRLESYLVKERSWEVEEWMEYYFSNPIMLIYVQRLLWGIYDEDYKLIKVFYCDEDLELYDVDDEEVDVEDGTYIRIVHPLHMDKELLSKWKEKVYDMDKEYEFEIINREVTLIPKKELDYNTTRILYDEEIPKGADYVAGFLLKKGWQKSTGDGGSLQFYKVNKRAGINAHAHIDGPAAYYQGGTVQAKIYEVYFTKYEARETKNLKEVPEVFFSEVIADLKALINA